MDDHPLTRRILAARDEAHHGPHCYSGGTLVCGWHLEHPEPRQPGRPEESPTYRSDMIAAGRGRLLR